MSGQRVGYIRVSTADQNPDRQLETIRAQLDRLFIDHASGTSKARPELAAMLLHVREGDSVYVHSIDRLARNLDDLRSIVSSLVERSVYVEFVKEGLRFSGVDGISKMLLSMMGALAEFEWSLIHERQAEGIALAKLRGKYTGRRPSLTLERAAELRRRCAVPGASKAAIAREFGIGESTMYDYLKRVPSEDASG